MAVLLSGPDGLWLWDGLAGGRGGADSAVGCGAEASTPQASTSTTAGTTSTAAAETSTTTAPEPVVPTWPLTGVPTDDAAGLVQPAIVVKVDNSPEARPHAGINQADIVYELQVEGITREHALGRLPDMEELARFVVHLAGLRSVSGQVFAFESRVT